MSPVDHPPQIYRSKNMHRTLYARSDPRGSNQAAARRAKFDVITAAMLTGGASGGWGMAKTLKSFAARRGDGRRCTEPTTNARRK
jgi:hypothetical protein